MIIGDYHNQQVLPLYHLIIATEQKPLKLKLDFFPCIFLTILSLIIDIYVFCFLKLLFD